MCQYKVWKEAEAWIDAEVAREDAAWDQLQQVQDTVPHVTITRDNIETPMSISMKSDIFLDDAAVATPSPTNSDITSTFSDKVNQSVSGHGQSNDHSVFADSPFMNAPTCIYHSSRDNYSKTDDYASFTNVISASVSARQLHVKLSSPDRKKITSPTDLKRR